MEGNGWKKLSTGPSRINWSVGFAKGYVILSVGGILYLWRCLGRYTCACHYMLSWQAHSTTNQVPF